MILPEIPSGTPGTLIGILLGTTSGFALGVHIEILANLPNGSPPEEYYEILQEDFVTVIHTKLLQEIRMKFFHKFMIQFLQELLDEFCIQFFNEFFQKILGSSNNYFRDNISPGIP